MDPLEVEFRTELEALRPEVRVEERESRTEVAEEWAQLAQVHVAADDTTIAAGRFFGQSKWRHVGIEIGTPAAPVYGSQIDARMSDLTGGAFKFSNEGGSSQIKALIYQKSGVAYTGTPARSSRLELTVNGIAEGSTTVFPRGALAWNGGAPIVKHLSGTAAWAPAELPQGAAATTIVAVPGAAPGDTVAVGFTQGIPAGAMLVGAVSAPGTAQMFLYGVDGFALARGARNEPAARAFLATVASPEGQVAFNRFKGSSPIRPDVRGEDLDAIGRETLAHLEHARIRMMVHPRPEWEQALAAFARDHDRDKLLRSFLAAPPGG